MNYAALAEEYRKSEAALEERIQELKRLLQTAAQPQHKDLSRRIELLQAEQRDLNNIRWELIRRGEEESLPC